MMSAGVRRRLKLSSWLSFAMFLE